MRDILQLDQKGQPQRWITATEAAIYYATDTVRWTVGDTCTTLRGGFNALSGHQSRIDVHPIIAVSGAAKVNLFDFVPSLTNAKLAVRDRSICVYCGKHCKAGDVTREHIVPKADGGRDEWKNVAVACKSCNGRKGCMSLDEVGFKLLYLPYTPSVYEDFILCGRNVRADVREWLAAKLPKNSRLC